MLVSLRACPLLYSLLHQFPHNVSQDSVGVATQVVTGVGGVYSVLAWCAEGMGLGQS